MDGNFFSSVLQDTSCQQCAARGEEFCCFATPLARGDCAKRNLLYIIAKASYHVCHPCGHRVCRLYGLRVCPCDHRADRHVCHLCGSDCSGNIHLHDDYSEKMGQNRSALKISFFYYCM